MVCWNSILFVTCFENYFVAIKTVGTAGQTVLIATTPAAAIGPAGGCIGVLP